MATLTPKKTKPQTTSPAKRRGGAHSKKSGPPKQSTTKRGKGKATLDKAAIKDIVEEIRNLQHDVSAGKLQVIEARIKIGARLNQLKQSVAHGEWEKVLDELRYDQRISQKLMRLASEEFDVKIRNIEPLLRHQLPIDIAKLDLLNRLTQEHCRRA